MFNLKVFDVAMAQGAQAAAQQPSFLEMLALPAVFVFIMYFLIIRPQSKKQKELQNLILNLKVGDEVITSSGIIGRIKSISDAFISLEVASNVQIKIVKAHIVSLTEKNQPKVETK